MHSRRVACATGMDFRKMVRLPTMPGKTLIVLATVVLFATALPFYLETHPISVSGLRSSLTALIVLVGSAMLVSVLAWARRRLTGPGFGLICLAVLALFATAIYRRFRQSSLESFGVLALAIAATALHLLMVTAGGAFIARLLRVRRISGLSQVVLSLLVGWTAWGWTAYLPASWACRTWPPPPGASERPAASSSRGDGRAWAFGAPWSGSR